MTLPPRAAAGHCLNNHPQLFSTFERFHLAGMWWNTHRPLRERELIYLRKLAARVGVELSE